MIWVDIDVVPLISRVSMSWIEVCGANLSHLEHLRLVVMRVDRLIVIAWIRHQLPPIVFDWSEYERAVRQLFEGAVLPLHHALDTSWIGSCVMSVWIRVNLGIEKSVRFGSAR